MRKVSEFRCSLEILSDFTVRAAGPWAGTREWQHSSSLGMKGLEVVSPTQMGVSCLIVLKMSLLGRLLF